MKHISYFMSKVSDLSLLNFSLLFLSALVLSACQHDEYIVSGEITGAPEGSMIALEQPDPNGGWLLLDSVELKGSGKFKLSHLAPYNPEIVRLRFGGRYIYLPVDSTETITVKAHASNFDTDFSLSGSDNAKNLERFEKQLIALYPHLNVPDSVEAFKRKVYMQFIKDSRASVVSYYVLTKTIEGKPLYDAADDYKYFAAAATSFRQYRPDDPHTALLESVSIEGMKRNNSARGRNRVFQAQEIDIMEITQPDSKGKMRSLSSFVGKGKPVVVYFQAQPSEETAATNMKLRKLFDSGRADIFQVSFDSDEYLWRKSAGNLPWTAVWAGDPTSARKLSTDYNITSLPLFFIYDSTGALIDRAVSYDELVRKL